MWAELEQRGFAVARQALDAAAVSEVRALLDALHTHAGPSGYGQIVHDTWRHQPALAPYLLEGPLAQLAATALGGEARLFQDHLVSKTPGTVDAVKWHQDYSYWPLDSPRGLTMWVALDPADVSNGCLHYAPESHRGGERAPANFIDRAELGVHSALPPLDPPTGGGVALPAQPGDVLLHDPLVLHTSPGNRTQRPRRAWSISWVHPDTCWAPNHAPHPFNWSLSPTPGAPLSDARFPRVVARSPR